MIDRLTSMAVFVKAADLRSFAAAASALKMSPQMVAKHVAQLERRLGGLLLARTTRSQSLTELGQSYYERCRIILAEVEAADALVPHADTAPSGRLRISAPVGAHVLIPLLTHYLAEYPQVVIDLVLTDRYVDLVEEGFEAVFRLGDLADSALVQRSLSQYLLVACASPTYLHTRGTPATPADLAGHDCLGYAYRTRPPERTWRFTRGGEIHQVIVNYRLEANDGVALKVAALAGAGVVCAAEAMLRDAIQDGRLVRILPDFELRSPPFHLLYRRDHRQTPKFARFVALAVALLSPERSLTA